MKLAPTPKFKIARGFQRVISFETQIKNYKIDRNRRKERQKIEKVEKNKKIGNRMIEIQSGKTDKKKGDTERKE